MRLKPHTSHLTALSYHHIKIVLWSDNVYASYIIIVCKRCRYRGIAIIIFMVEEWKRSKRFFDVDVGDSKNRLSPICHHDKALIINNLDVNGDR